MRRIGNNSTNKAPNRPKWMMPVIVTACICIAGLLVYNLLDNHGTIDSPEPPVLVQPTSPKGPKSATIYIDDSRSMMGYVKSGNFNYVMADLMSIYPGTKAQSVNDTIVISQSKELTTKLMSGVMTSRGESLLNEDLKKIVDKVVGTDNIAFFVTDAIMSGSTADINKDPRYNINQKQSLMHAISEVFKGKNVAVSIYRLTSDFNGTYYCFDNTHQNIHASRAYFVLAIGGKPEIVAHFKQQIESKKSDKLFKFIPKNEIHFIDNKSVNTPPSLSAGKNGEVVLPIENNVVRFDLQKVNKGNGLFNVSIPAKTFCNYSFTPEELKDHVEVFTDGTRYKPIDLRYDSLSHNIRFQVDRNNLSTRNNYAPLRITIPYFTPKWIDWPSVSIEGTNVMDDHFMLKSEMASEGTFLFSYFIQGIKNGVVSDKDKYIYDCTLYFTEKQ